MANKKKRYKSKVPWTYGKRSAVSKAKRFRGYKNRIKRARPEY